MKAIHAFLGLTVIMSLASCQPNPLGPVPAGSASGQVSAGQIEATGPGSDVFFSPATIGSITTLLFTPAGTIASGQGIVTKTYKGPSTGGNPLGTVNGNNSSGNAPLILGGSPATTHLCPPLGDCSNVPAFRGAGGPSGNYTNDFFVRWYGYKGPDPSLHYASLVMNFKGSGTLTDISAYRGFTFWARGHGNFAVNIDAPFPDPYSGYNLYLKRFGSELNGDEQWKQIIVYFSEMVQEYGLAADKPNVLKKARGLQFDQQGPYTANFQLDIDYIRFFK